MATSGINFLPVASQNLSMVGYDPVELTLYITFVSGPTYAYHEVTADVFANLLSSASKGKFFNANIRDVYEFEQVG